MYVSIELGDKRNAYLSESEVLDKLENYGIVQGFNHKADYTMVISSTLYGQVVVIDHDDETGQIKIYEGVEEFFLKEDPKFISLKEVTLQVTINEVG